MSEEMNRARQADYDKWRDRNGVTGGDSLLLRMWNDAYEAAWNRRAVSGAASGEADSVKPWKDRLFEESPEVRNLPEGAIDEMGLYYAHAEIADLRAILATQPAGASPGQADECGCTRCLNESGKTADFLGMQVPIASTRMVLCAICGNKRCPHANDHRNACNDSNEPGQPGSNYPAIAALSAKEQG